MMAGDLWSRIWLLAVTYPALTFMFAVILCLVATLLALALVSMCKPERLQHQREDDDAQARAVRRPAGLLPMFDADRGTPQGSTGLETTQWRRSGGNWRGEL